MVKWFVVWQSTLAKPRAVPVAPDRMQSAPPGGLGRIRLNSVSGYFRFLPVLAKNQDILTSVKRISHRWGTDGHGWEAEIGMPKSEIRAVGPAYSRDNPNE